jgi:hypothetical protein
MNVKFPKLLKREVKPGCLREMPEAQRLCDLVVIIAVSDGEWQGVSDLLESLETYIDCDYQVVAVDDATTDGTHDRLLQAGIWTVRNPEKLTFYGLDLSLRRAFYQALRLFESSIYLKIDPDALIIGPGLYEAMQAKFAEDQSIGLIGTLHVDWNGQPRDLSECRDRMLLVKKTLGEPYGLAIRNGYEAGDGVQGGAYAISRACLREMDNRGWLRPSRKYNPPIVRGRQVPEDSLITMLAYAAGYRVADFGGPGQPFGIWDVGLPMSPEELVAQNRLVTHSIKYDDQDSIETRKYFKIMRDAFKKNGNVANGPGLINVD